MLKWSKLSEYKIRKVVECFSLDLTATQTAALLRLNRKTVNALYQRFRLLITWQRMNQRREFGGVVEVDESYFWPQPRTRPSAATAAGPRNAQATGLRHLPNAKEIIPDCSQATLRAVIRGRIDPASVVCSDGWPGYDGLVDVGFDKHIRINKQKTFAKGRAHINGIEAFWSFTKRRLAKFNGVKVNFGLHLKECEWRYSKSASFLAKNLLTLIKSPVEVLV